MRTIILLLGLLLLPAMGNAAPPITIFGNYSKPPKIFADDSGTPAGILVDILRELEPLTGLTFHISLHPWKRAYALAEAGRGGVTGLSMTSERLKIFDYTDVVYYDDLILIVRKGEEFSFRSMEDLRGKVIGSRMGSVYGEEFAAAKDAFLTLDEDTGGLVNRLEKLLAGRIDVAIAGPGRAGFNAALAKSPTLQQAKDKFSILSEPLKRDPNYIGFAKSANKTEAVQRINDGLARLWSNGTIAAIETRWIQRPPPATSPPTQ